MLLQLLLQDQLLREQHLCRKRLSEDSLLCLCQPYLYLYLKLLWSS